MNGLHSGHFIHLPNAFSYPLLTEAEAREWADRRLAERSRRIGMFSAVLNDSASLLDIYRFAMPEIKCFRVINCDYPLGHNSFAVNYIFS